MLIDTLELGCSKHEGRVAQRHDVSSEARGYSQKVLPDLGESSHYQHASTGAWCMCREVRQYVTVRTCCSTAMYPAWEGAHDAASTWALCHLHGGVLFCSGSSSMGKLLSCNFCTQTCVVSVMSSLKASSNRRACSRAARYREEGTWVTPLHLDMMSVQPD